MLKTKKTKIERDSDSLYRQDGQIEVTLTIVHRFAIHISSYTG